MAQPSLALPYERGASTGELAGLVDVILVRSLAPALLLFCFVTLCLVYPLSVRGNQFNSPDEGANYLFTKVLAETGRLWYSNDFTAADDENLLHPRAALTHEGRVVPQYYLGLPVLYAPIYAIVGDKIHYLSAVFAIGCAWAIYRVSSLAFGARAWQAWAALLACTPLIFYLNRSFMNVTPAITLALLGVWLLVRYVKLGGRMNLLFASALFALSMLCRYEYVLFLTPMVLLTLAMKHSLRSRTVVVDGLLTLAVLVVVFLLPVLALNKVVYGDWMTYGPSLFNDKFYPERTVVTAEGPVESTLRTIREVLLPSYSFDLRVLGQNLLRLTLFLVPTLSVAALLGALKLIQERTVPLWQWVAGSFVLVYLVIYRGSSEFWGASSMEPSFDVSFVRYWLLAYLAMVALAIYSLAKLKDAATRALLVIAILCTGPVSVYTLHSGSLSELATAVADGERWADQLVMNTEPDAVIYAGRHDKVIMPHRDVAAWWNGEEFYDPRQVAVSMSRIVAAGRPVYLYEEPEIDRKELERELAAVGLAIRPTKAWNLVSIQSLDRQAID